MPLFRYRPTSRRELRRGGDLITVEPKVFDLLTFLVQNRDRVVSKGNLLQSVWGGQIVSDSELATRINALRRRSATMAPHNSWSAPSHARGIDPDPDSAAVSSIGRAAQKARAPGNRPGRAWRLDISRLCNRCSRPPARGSDPTPPMGGE
jgi:hypothetical protein